MKITKKDIEGANLAPELATEILSLFDDVKAKETEITGLRAKLPTDSQKVVESVDHQKFLDATAELERLKQEIAAKLESDGSKESDSFLTAFSAFFS